ncbi:hypothetical protein NCAS_0B07090 [Naumovozyma castellii]|uniref:RRM domain-containing protein n=1 Tax=Naumovozyma castellii TaxID=27288 RepID=G0VA63_NAUCA|nr:hypothetical protein NCAS_0B07090 [Naumovozyma castellii CBS 4309]CCC68793.1 hypothetical protein NCAS_0B07090 [Naumovozyma castellii CBS 4309]
MARSINQSKRKSRGKSLKDRIVSTQEMGNESGWSDSWGDSQATTNKNNRNRRHENKNEKEGYRVVKGKLVSANDVGALLREAADKVEERKQKKANKILGRNSPVNISRSSRAGVNQNNRRRNRANINKRNSAVVHHFPNDESIIAHPGVIDLNQQPDVERRTNQLIISTNTDASNKLLVLYNLTLGVNAENLKKILQRLANVAISHVKVRDLPSGSAIANVWLAHPTMADLQKVRNLFHGSLVDGRTIQVSISSSETKSFSY